MPIWSDEEIDYLKDNYEKIDYIKIGKKLNRSANSVRQKAYHLNLPRKQKGWTEDELIYLEYFVYVGDEKLKEAAKFLNRSLNAVECMLQRLRKENKDVCYMQRNWTEAEDDFIKKYYKVMSGPTIALRLGRTYGAVRDRRSFLGLKVRKRVR